jgi:hypothetical protein
MSDSAEDEGSLLSTAFEVGLDGSYRGVETDAAGTSTWSRIGKGAEREEMEQLLRLAQSSETNERKAGTLEAKLIGQDAALEKQRKQMEQVKSRLAEYEMQSYDKHLPVQRETKTRDTDDVVQEMQQQMAIQKVLTELRGRSQQTNSKVRDSRESDGGSSGSSSGPSSEDDIEEKKERSHGTTKTKARKRLYVNRQTGMSRSMLDALEISSTDTRRQISTSGSSQVWHQFRSRTVAMPSLLLHLHVGVDCAAITGLRKPSGSVYWDMLSQVRQQRYF